jgi:hypothetical protein
MRTDHVVSPLFIFQPLLSLLLRASSSATTTVDTSLQTRHFYYPSLSPKSRWLVLRFVSPFPLRLDSCLSVVVVAVAVVVIVFYSKLLVNPPEVCVSLLRSFVPYVLTYLLMLGKAPRKQLATKAARKTAAAVSFFLYEPRCSDSQPPLYT